MLTSALDVFGSTLASNILLMVVVVGFAYLLLGALNSRLGSSGSNLLERNKTPKHRDQRDQLVNMPIDLAVAYKGGFGQIFDVSRKKCPSCDNGVIDRDYGATVCGECDGSGMISVERVVNVPIPKRTSDKTILTIPKLDEVNSGSRRVLVLIKPHHRFRLRERDIEFDCYVPVTIAKDGGLIPIDMPDRSVFKLPIPCEAIDNQRVVLKGFGLRDKGVNEFGDLVAVIKIADSLNDEGPSDPSGGRLPSEETLMKLDAERRRRQRDFRLNNKKK